MTNGNCAVHACSNSSYRLKKMEECKLFDTQNVFIFYAKIIRRASSGGDGGGVGDVPPPSKSHLQMCPANTIIVPTLGS